MAGADFRAHSCFLIHRIRTPSWATRIDLGPEGIKSYRNIDVSTPHTAEETGWIN